MFFSYFIYVENIEEAIEMDDMPTNKIIGGIEYNEEIAEKIADKICEGLVDEIVENAVRIAYGENYKRVKKEDIKNNVEQGKL